MKIRRSLIQAFFVIVCVVLVGSIAEADTIRLKDGSVLRGKVISYLQRKFTIVVYIGGTQSQHIVPVDDIESVEFDGAEAVARVEPQGAFTATPETAAPAIRETPPRENPSRETQPADSIQTDPPVGAAPQPTTPEPDTGVVSAIAEKTVSVAAAADWTSTEIRVQRGQRIVISSTGEVDLGDGTRSGPDGVVSQDARKLITSKPTGALIAVVGDDNDDFVFIGRSTEFVAKHNGILFLSVNEGNLKDNSGAYVARVRVLSNR